MEEEKDRKLSCNVTILDRKFKYTVPAEDESLIRNTIRGVSDKLAELRSRKNFNDNQELLTVALVQVALEKARLENWLKIRLNTENVTLYEFATDNKENSGK